MGRWQRGLLIGRVTPSNSVLSVSVNKNEIHPRCFGDQTARFYFIGTADSIGKSCAITINSSAPGKLNLDLYDPKTAPDILSEALRSLRLDASNLDLEMRCPACATRFNLQKAVQSCSLGNELQCTNQSCGALIPLLKINEWRMPKTDDEVEQAKQKMFEELSKRMSYAPKDSEWADMLFQTEEVTEENETMEFEWETTEQYLEMISKFGSH
jgi:hypothetical protein